MKLMLVEDNQGLREQMKWALTGQYEICEAGSALECREQFSRHAPRLVCLDMGLDNEPVKGLELIDELLTIDRGVKVIVITAHTGETLGTQAIEKGAFDFLRKPVDIDELSVLLNRARRILELEKGPVAAAPEAMQTQPEFAMVGTCEPMRQIFDLIRKLARTQVNVLITGDSGTGKELCARAIHFHSERQNKPFVPINCGAIPETLLESELFGYAKGAFTGAAADKVGLIESANGGTLFLDEIGDMPKLLQVKLLRFMEDQTFQRVGDARQYRADVRIVAATNKKGLDKENNESMRTDLYYRLSEFEIYLPPLKDRGVDILLLAHRIVERNRTKFSMPKLKISNRAESLIKQYTWPGNIRELENKLSRASITCANQVIEPQDLNLSVTDYSELNFKDARNLFEKEYIAEALRRVNYVISDAARRIGVSRPTLYDMIRKHGIDVSIEEKLVQE